MINLDVSTLFKMRVGCCQLLFVSHPFSKSCHCSSVPTQGVIESQVQRYWCTGGWCGFLEDRIATNTGSIISISKSVASEFMLVVLLHVSVWLTLLCAHCDLGGQLQASACTLAKALVYFMPTFLKQLQPLSLPGIQCVCIVVCVLQPCFVLSLWPLKALFNLHQNTSGCCFIFSCL